MSDAYRAFKVELLFPIGMSADDILDFLSDLRDDNPRLVEWAARGEIVGLSAYEAAWRFDRPDLTPKENDA